MKDEYEEAIKEALSWDEPDDVIYEYCYRLALKYKGAGSFEAVYWYNKHRLNPPKKKNMPPTT